VLVVDDEPEVLAVACGMLQALGCRALGAASGPEAVDLLRRHGAAVDLVILDLTMPGMSGEETLKAMRCMRPEIPVLLSSGYSEAEAMRRFVGRGLAGFLQKPYLPETLSANLRQALPRRAVLQR
jgi:CheY-like chemotaxis protein